MKFVYEKFDVYDFKSPKPPLQKGALLNCYYLNYKSTIRNKVTLKSLFFKEGFREILSLLKNTDNNSNKNKKVKF